MHKAKETEMRENVYKYIITVRELIEPEYRKSIGMKKTKQYYQPD